MAFGSVGREARYSAIDSTQVRPIASSVATIANQNAKRMLELASPVLGSSVMATATADPMPPSNAPRYRDR
jgi:hypothetical protein